MAERRLIVLGSTGSIGTQTLAVVSHLNGLHARGGWPVRYQVVGLAAGSNAERLWRQAAEFSVGDIALATCCNKNASQGVGRVPAGVRLRSGSDSAERLVREVECDVVVAAMVGAAGLPATLAAVELGRDVALANKETLVAAGALVVPAAMKSGSRLLPVDSEHSAVWQCVWGRGKGAEGQRGNAPTMRAAGDDVVAPPLVLGKDVARVVLTASGGALRGWPAERAYAATPADVLKHPTWSMGPKVTVDSASLMNKALEVIEAHWLFGVEADRIGVTVHPQSVVHSMVEYTDGCVMAQLGAPDMRTPIQVALSFPERHDAAGARLDWSRLARLDFETADEGRYPALRLARRVIESGAAGGTGGAILNGANEAAVSAFLAQEGSRSMPFGRIIEIVAQTMEAVPVGPVRGLADVMEADGAARAHVQEQLRRDGLMVAMAS